MSILITGARGQLGQDIEKEGKKRGFQTFALSSAQLDITSRHAVSEAVRKYQPDIVINCAAYNAVDQAETEWKKAYAVNGIGVKHLALESAKSGAVLVHYSTDYVFDGEKKTPYTIADRPHPLSRYGESKLLGEELVQRHAQRYFLVRTSWVFGSGNMNFARKALAWSHDKQEIEVVTDQVSSPTYTVDLAKATLDLLETGSYGLYHITNQDSCSRFEWVKTILNATGWTGRLIPTTSDKFPTPAMRPHYSVLDNFGSGEILGYVLPSWRDATSRFLEEMK